nr:unnamed protein product [Callosobruchus chinensis]
MQLVTVNNIHLAAEKCEEKKDELTMTPMRRNGNACLYLHNGSVDKKQYLSGTVSLRPMLGGNGSCDGDGGSENLQPA